MTDVNETYLNAYCAFYVIQAFPLIYWYDFTIHLIIFEIARGHEVNLQTDESDKPDFDAFKEEEMAREEERGQRSQ